jgi:peptidoglycan/xylan/chitin deacetylase (PgdA/CDA1 family)
MNTAITGSLFDDDAAQTSLLVPTLAQSKPASKEQRQFQRLVEQIELKREQLRNWQTYALRYNQRICNELEPLRAQLRTGQQQMVALIDELLTRRGKGHRLGSALRAKLRGLLLNLVEGLLAEQHDLALEALHDRYSDVSHEQVRDDAQRAQELLEGIIGQRFDGAPTGESQERAHPGAKRSRAGSAKAQARQAHRDEAAREVRQSLREVFRKLASALHPDREPDEQERQRKTQLMARVNQAYDAGDLLTLLTLQLEIEQISATSLAAASRERLVHYNQILREQLIELDLELEHCIAPFRLNLSSPRGGALTIAEVDHGLSAACSQLSVVIRELKADMVAFRDPQGLRESLKHFELVDLEPELDDFTEFMVALRQPRRRRR